MVLIENLQLEVIICSKIDLTGERASASHITTIQSGEKIHESRGRSMLKYQNNFIVGILYNLFCNRMDTDDTF